MMWSSSLNLMRYQSLTLLLCYCGSVGAFRAAAMPSARPPSRSGHHAHPAVAPIVQPQRGGGDATMGMMSSVGPAGVALDALGLGLKVGWRVAACAGVAKAGVVGLQAAGQGDKIELASI